ncbi:hypothetical protein [Streptomyces sp. NPDC047028]|uniref:hypothetical protein n=1 Tax=Streptomyces sp. NPDC047028 TaxID=3155793 RepID=UPI0033EBD247
MSLAREDRQAEVAPAAGRDQAVYEDLQLGYSRLEVCPREWARDANQGGQARAQWSGKEEAMSNPVERKKSRRGPKEEKMSGEQARRDREEEAIRRRKQEKEKREWLKHVLGDRGIEQVRSVAREFVEEYPRDVLEQYEKEKFVMDVGGAEEVRDSAPERKELDVREELFDQAYVVSMAKELSEEIINEVLQEIISETPQGPSEPVISVEELRTEMGSGLFEFRSELALSLKTLIEDILRQGDPAMTEPVG